MNRRTVIVLSLATFLLHAWPMWRWLSTLDQEPVTFAVYSPSAPADNDPPHMAGEFISHDPGLGMVHVGSICEMADGSLVACWYGGTREGARDAVIYLAMRASGEAMSWSKPRVIVDRQSASRELHRFVKKVGNSVIFADSEDRLWLIYVTITVGGWSGSSLNAKISHDGGTTWTASQRLTLSPFLNVSELVRNNPLPLRGGGFLIPIYHECLGKFPETLWIRTGQGDQRITFRKIRMAGGWRTTLGLGFLSALIGVIPLGGLPLARWLISINANFSISLTALVFGKVWENASGIRLLDRKAILSSSIFGLTAGLALYPMALGLGSLDPYEFGWSFSWLFVLLMVITAILLFTKNRFGIVLVACILGYDLQLLESPNLWDYLVDPFFALISGVILGGWLIRGARSMRSHGHSECRTPS
ncbi:MAG: exo-alpha-sialidase [Deltaproteobacteria bacterium]|nr:exo-alpha-sialidase [Deltaproteobacteria bacterium]